MGKKIQNIIDVIRCKPRKHKINFKEKLSQHNIIMQDGLWHLPNGLKLEDARDMAFIINEIFIGNEYEFRSTHNFVVFDIGMNKGTASLFFALKPFVDTIYGFEPFKNTYDIAKQNFELNKHLSNKIISFNFGLSDSESIIEVPYDPRISGSMSTSNPILNDIYRDSDKHKIYIEKVELKKTSSVLGPIIDDNKSKKIALKIDTEGSEFAILKDLDEAGLLKRIDVIVLEYHFKSCQELADRLMNNGFIVFYDEAQTDIGILRAVRNS